MKIGAGRAACQCRQHGDNPKQDLDAHVNDAPLFIRAKYTVIHIIRHRAMVLMRRENHLTTHMVVWNFKMIKIQ
jgi:hypothetical protein